MKTLVEVLDNILGEGIEEFIKNDKIKNFIDPSVTGDVKVEIYDKIYTIKNFGSILFTCLKANTDFNLFKVTDKINIKISKETLRKVAVSPFATDYPCIYLNDPAEIETTFKIIKK